MKRSALIEILKALPGEDPDVYFVEYAGCCECNPEAMPNYHEVESVELQPEGHYPRHELRNVIVLR